MTRKQAKKRKQKKQPVRIRLPRIPFAKISAIAVAALLIVLSYELSAALLDRPIRALTVVGPFERVSALQIEAAIGNELNRGFLSANLSRIRQRVVDLPWIDTANVVRRWPDTLQISVTEQVPAALWDERDLLNTRGELFVKDARHIPAELPRLSGPPGRVADVARRYLDVREQLIPLGLDLRQVELDARGAWHLTLLNGIEVRLGRRDTDVRTRLFVDVAANIVSRREADIRFVDMRYSNGFSIGWDDGRGALPETREPSQSALVADRNLTE